MEQHDLERTAPTSADRPSVRDISRLSFDRGASSVRGAFLKVGAGLCVAGATSLVSAIVYGRVAENPDAYVSGMLSGGAVGGFVGGAAIVGSVVRQIDTQHQRSGAAAADHRA